MQSFRSIASSATALVRSTVRMTEFICRRIGSNGASRSTFWISQSFIDSQWRRASPGKPTSSIVNLVCQGFWITQRTQLNLAIGSYQSESSSGTYSFRIEFITARVKGDALSVVYVLIVAACLKADRHMGRSTREKIELLIFRRIRGCGPEFS